MFHQLFVFHYYMYSPDAKLDDSIFDDSAADPDIEVSASDVDVTHNGGSGEDRHIPRGGDIGEVHWVVCI